MIDETVIVPQLADLLDASAATEEFRHGAIEAQTKGKPNDFVVFSAANPPIKVFRALCGLLEAYPRLKIRKVEIDGESGCSDYHGTAIVNDGEKKFEFRWDCAWKAKEMGWNDYFGSPDQIRAAKVYGYRCFEYFREV